MTTPMSERETHKRQRTPADVPNEPLSKKAKARARQTSDERFGRKTGVIDLTLDDSSSDEDDNEQPFPERQYVPQANNEPNAPLLGRRTASPPRTFTRDLPPLPAHAKQAPIVHRSKPPIKPENRRQTSNVASPAPASRPIFNRGSRPLTPANNTSQSVASISGSTQYSQPGPVRRSTANSSTTPTTPKAAGPFVEDDGDSDSEEESATKSPDRTVPRPSVTRLIDRPRNDTPKRVALGKMLEESKLMRERAHERLLEEIGGGSISTRTNNAPAQNAVNQSQVSTQSTEDQSFLGVPRPR